MTCGPGLGAGVRRGLGRPDRPADQQRGRLPPTLTRTADGFESKFGTNHLGHFALTNLLLEHVTGRVMTVASQAERLGRLDFDDLNWEHRPYRRPAPTTTPSWRTCCSPRNCSAA